MKYTGNNMLHHFGLLLIIGCLLPLSANAAAYRWYQCDYVKNTGNICEPRCITKSFHTGGNAFQNDPDPITPQELEELRTSCTAICADAEYTDCTLKELANGTRCEGGMNDFEPRTNAEQRFSGADQPFLSPDLQGDHKTTNNPAMQAVCAAVVEEQGPGLGEPVENEQGPAAIVGSVSTNKAKDITLMNPIQGNPSVPLLLGQIISGLLGIVGSLTLFAFIYGGFVWLTSGGSADKVAKGTHTMQYAVIGLFIIFGAYAILSTLISGLRGSASTAVGAVPNDCAEVYGTQNFQCLPVTECSGLPSSATWADCKNASSDVCKINHCGTAPNVVCCKK